MSNLIWFFIGCIFTLFVGSYAISSFMDGEIKRDKLVMELIEELRIYKNHYEAVSDMNKDYWG